MKHLVKVNVILAPRSSHELADVLRVLDACRATYVTHASGSIHARVSRSDMTELKLVAHVFTKKPKQT